MGGGKMLIDKLCEPGNNVGSAVLDRCERGDAGRRIQSGRRKKQDALLDPTSPFYVDPRRLPARPKPAATRQHSVKTEIVDVEERLQTITNRISLLKSESERIDRETREINDRAEHVRSERRRREEASARRRPASAQRRRPSAGGPRKAESVKEEPDADVGVPAGGRTSGRSLTVTRRKVREDRTCGRTVAGPHTRTRIDRYDGPCATVCAREQASYAPSGSGGDRRARSGARGVRGGQDGLDDEIDAASQRIAELQMEQERMDRLTSSIHSRTEQAIRRGAAAAPSVAAPQRAGRSSIMMGAGAGSAGGGHDDRIGCGSRGGGPEAQSDATAGAAERGDAGRAGDAGGNDDRGDDDDAYCVVAVGGGAWER